MHTRKVKNLSFILGVTALLVSVTSCGGCRQAVPDQAMNQYIARTRSVGRLVELISGVSPTLDQEFRQGDTIPISYRLTSDTIALDSAVLYLRGRRVGAMSGGVWPYIASAEHPTGRVPYRISAYLGGDSTVRVGEFAVRADSAPARYGYRVVKSYPHDNQAYTQGLFWHEGFLYESTGMTGQSTLRKVDLPTGEVLQSVPLEEEYFGEGAALLDGKIYQITWENNTGFIYDLATLEPLGQFGYTGAGWGLTTDGQYLYMSDGTEKIFVLDPQTFRPLRTIEVYSEAGRVTQINEMEWIEGEIWANIYLTDQIVRIDPETGAVIGIIDLKRILPPADKDMSTDVLNGIAYDSATGRIFVTGKNWKKLFEIEVIEQ
ncbi:MAG: glutaminyl-peptide cyclotransferase [Rikenellaceae bacterium]|jgi:glutamine cyclotransferase|nr:glutaminyl-peptide cyclotransferase [Rikenellaceae bacterium]